MENQENMERGYRARRNVRKPQQKLRPEKQEKQKKKINRYGTLMALFVWIPLIGNVSNIALGFYPIKPPPLFLMFIGHMIRFLLWMILY